MQWELGPISAEDVQRWSRTARRVVAELRTAPAVPGSDAVARLDDDLLAAWSDLIDRWSIAAAACGDDFRWSETMDNDQAEFLLHGLELCLRNPHARCCLTGEDIEQHRRFTFHLISAMIDGLEIEGRGCGHFADELESVGG